MKNFEHILPGTKDRHELAVELHTSCISAKKDRCRIKTPCSGQLLGDTKSISFLSFFFLHNQFVMIKIYKKKTMWRFPDTGIHTIMPRIELKRVRSQSA